LRGSNKKELQISSSRLQTSPVTIQAALNACALVRERNKLFNIQEKRCILGDFKEAEHKFYANWWPFTKLDCRKNLAAFQVAHHLLACLWKRHLTTTSDKE
jgi:hypothetical protein